MAPGISERDQKNGKFGLVLTNEVSVILARTDTRGVVLQRVQDERFGKVVSWQNADVACSRVESVCESGEECSSFG